MKRSEVHKDSDNEERERGGEISWESNQMWDQHLTKNQQKYKKQKFSIAELGDKSSWLDYQNMVVVVKENKGLNGNSCFPFKLSK